ncbi:Prefoldin subunit 3 [Lamellibrachia satsuma]|nr:Prefoldin subunit 3 [Lamellibrachia satsuma]
MSDERSEVAEKAVTGIPKAIFVDDVDEYMKRADINESAEVALRNLEESHSKYKFMEYNLTTKKSRLKTQVPDIKTSLNIVRHLQSKKQQLTLTASSECTNSFGGNIAENANFM